MALTKSKKQEMLSGIKESLKNSKACIIADASSVKVADMQDVRKKLRENNAYMKVLKNTLFKKALKDHGLELDEDILTRPLAVAFDENDEVSPAKILYEKAKEIENLNILGAIIGKEFFDTSKVNELAQLPAKEELYAKLVGSINSPITGFVNVLAGNMRGLVNVLRGRKEKME